MPSLKTTILINAAVAGVGFLGVQLACNYVKSIYDPKNAELLRERIAKAERFPMEQQFPMPKI